MAARVSAILLVAAVRNSVGAVDCMAMCHSGDSSGWTLAAIWMS